MIDDASVGQLLEAWDIPGATPKHLPHPGAGSRTWDVTTASGRRYVAKLMFDARQFTEPGLRVAAALDDVGVTTGRPVLTRSGHLSLDVDDGTTRGTLAVLRHVPGQPLDLAGERAPTVAGGLLGRVHAALQRVTSQAWVPGDLLAWCARDAGNEPAMSALSRLVAFERRHPLTRGVVYGDPAPEILVEEESHGVALIDWGTPSWGPLMHDVACWLRYLSSGGRSGGPDRSAFLEAYLAHMTLDSVELEALTIFDALYDALGLRSRW